LGDAKSLNMFFIHDVKDKKARDQVRRQIRGEIRRASMSNSPYMKHKRKNIG
jgi:hypothetical protein